MPDPSGLPAFFHFMWREKAARRSLQVIQTIWLQSVVAAVLIEYKLLHDSSLCIASGLTQWLLVTLRLWNLTSLFPVSHLVHYLSQSPSLVLPLSDASNSFSLSTMLLTSSITKGRRGTKIVGTTAPAQLCCCHQQLHSPIHHYLPRCWTVLLCLCILAFTFLSPTASRQWAYLHMMLCFLSVHYGNVVSMGKPHDTAARLP